MKPLVALGLGLALAGSLRAADPAPPPAKLRLLILSGANNHDWKTTTPVLQKFYEESGRFDVAVSENVPALTGADFANYDALVCNYTTYPKIEGHRWPVATERALLDYIAAGHGFVLFHAASTAWADWPEFGDLIGLTWQKDKATGANISGHGANHSFAVTLTDADHPVTKGMQDFQQVPDELYHRQLLHPTAKVLATAYSSPDKKGSGADEPMVVVTEHGKGRVFHCAMGHHAPAMAGAGFHALMLRGTEWAATGKVTLPAPEGLPPATTKSLEEQQSDFLKLKFGMFIHFNLATYKGVQWVSGYHSPAEFNPGGRIDTDAWADAAKSAGMKYAVLTVKHVAGFCLWDSKYTTYDVMHPDCPYKEDLVAQFIRSFKSRGLKVGLYYCWRHPGFGAEYKVLPPECDPATHSLKEQVEFQKMQIAELIQKYPDVFYIWNDGLDLDIMPAAEALAFFRKIRPDVLVSCNWWDWSKKGTAYADIAVTEMTHFPETNALPGETCWCLEQGWFRGEGASPMTAREVFDLLNTVNDRHSNLLLNVGPDKQGRFSESSVKVLAEVGKSLHPDNAGKP